MPIKKMGNKWCVLHGTPHSATDKPAGTVMKCWSVDEFGDEGARKRARRMHTAILFSQGRIKENN